MLLITGASGRIAPRAAALLAQRGCGLRLMTRTPEQAPQLDGSEVVRGDFADPAILDNVFAGMSAALVISGSCSQENVRYFTGMHSKQPPGRV